MVNNLRAALNMIEGSFATAARSPDSRSVRLDGMAATLVPAHGSVEPDL